MEIGFKVKGEDGGYVGDKMFLRVSETNDIMFSVNGVDSFNFPLEDCDDLILAIDVLKEKAKKEEDELNAYLSEKK